jgi:hypothetical protein
LRSGVQLEGHDLMVDDVLVAVKDAAVQAVAVLPKIILEFEAGNTANAAEVFGLFVTIWGLIQFLFSPLLGALSDR